MGDDDWILLSWMCLGGWPRSAPRPGTSEFSFAAGQIAGGAQNALRDSSDRRVSVIANRVPYSRISEKINVAATS